MSQNRSHAVMSRRYGRLSVIAPAPNIETRRRLWLCRCDCGTERVVRVDHLQSGATKSCGCLGREAALAASTRHGMARRGSLRSREYHSWADAKKRCRNPNATAFKDYCARGIAMCDRWLLSFTDFLADMGPCPDGLTLERIDNERGYEPGNCRWATRSEQMANNRRTVTVGEDGERICLKAYAERHGISYKALHHQHRTRRLSLREAHRVVVENG